VRGEEHRATRLLLRDDPRGEPVPHRPVQSLLGLVEDEQGARPDEAGGEQQPGQEEVVDAEFSEVDEGENKG
jgi:hypothetical protein